MPLEALIFDVNDMFCGLYNHFNLSVHVEKSQWFLCSQKKVLQIFNVNFFSAKVRMNRRVLDNN